MSLAVAIQMDPIESVNIDADSTFVLALEAEARGHLLYHYGPRNLAFKNGRVHAWARPLKVRRERGNHFTLGAPESIDLAGVDVVLMRQDPPFDMAYITATHLLERIHPETLVVNDPAAVRNAPEKLFVTQFPTLMPPTLITSDRREIDIFRDEHQATSSSSRCSAMAARACSACAPATRISIRCSRCSPSAARTSR